MVWINQIEKKNCVCRTAIRCFDMVSENLYLVVNKSYDWLKQISWSVSANRMVCLLQFFPGIFPSSFLCVDAYFYLAHLGLQFASRHHRTPIEPPPSLSLCTPRYDFAVMDVGLRGGERGSQLCTIVRLVVVGIPDPDTFMHPEK